MEFGGGGGVHRVRRDDRFGWRVDPSFRKMRWRRTPLFVTLFSIDEHRREHWKAARSHRCRGVLSCVFSFQPAARRRRRRWSRRRKKTEIERKSKRPFRRRVADRRRRLLSTGFPATPDRSPVTGSSQIDKPATAKSISGRRTIRESG